MSRKRTMISLNRRCTTTYNVGVKIEALRTAQKWTVLVISGPIDEESAPEFERACRTELKDGVTGLAVDLTDVEIVTEAGLRALIEILKSIKRRSGSMTLINPSDTVINLLGATGFLVLFSIVHDPDRQF